MQRSELEGRVMQAMGGAELLWHVHGLVPLLRDVVEALHTEVEGEGDIPKCEIRDFVVRLDFLGNSLTDAHDAYADACRESGLDAPLSWGIAVHR